ncbi:uncharacterized protein MONOS_2384 [Monocercomonoides exilis]|uniref:uncharacterized protein n=1 Tax=Monocercomonoides exilis TaxID=2049356 RepID=UPI00355ABDDD|nr:hypothetical protein MONOS_2384 [Monocercomonoides exilis]|eukprot:MONOS_2384.1-p1 / transcript=MONOS_2384.1 / gene=MONOS_2384 / organism=Monocercomonoides_exilis_PA203 / gene_product=unspecified product / transcript_product=unspecified product / location=Mono_scaffold00049:34748-39767(+) / protein_length=1545 / sequence_SO=supercontig / SO=protein_coding / is_pseudo=false
MKNELFLLKDKLKLLEKYAVDEKSSVQFPSLPERPNTSSFLRTSHLHNSFSAEHRPFLAGGKHSFHVPLVTEGYSSSFAAVENDHYDKPLPSIPRGFPPALSPNPSPAPRTSFLRGPVETLYSKQFDAQSSLNYDNFSANGMRHSLSSSSTQSSMGKNMFKRTKEKASILSNSLVVSGESGNSENQKKRSLTLRSKNAQLQDEEDMPSSNFIPSRSISPQQRNFSSKHTFTDNLKENSMSQNLLFPFQTPVIYSTPPSIPSSPPPPLRRCIESTSSLSPTLSPSLFCRPHTSMDDRNWRAEERRIRYAASLRQESSVPSATALFWNKPKDKDQSNSPWRSPNSCSIDTADSNCTNEPEESDKLSTEEVRSTSKDWEGQSGRCSANALNEQDARELKDYLKATHIDGEAATRQLSRSNRLSMSTSPTPSSPSPHSFTRLTSPLRPTAPLRQSVSSSALSSFSPLRPPADSASTRSHQSQEASSGLIPSASSETLQRNPSLRSVHKQTASGLFISDTVSRYPPLASQPLSPTMSSSSTHLFFSMTPTSDAPAPLGSSASALHVHPMSLSQSLTSLSASTPVSLPCSTVTSPTTLSPTVTPAAAFPIHFERPMSLAAEFASSLSSQNIREMQKALMKDSSDRKESSNRAGSQEEFFPSQQNAQREDDTIAEEENADNIPIDETKIKSRSFNQTNTTNSTSSANNTTQLSHSLSRSQSQSQPQSLSSTTRQHSTSRSTATLASSTSSASSSTSSLSNAPTPWVIDESELWEQLRVKIAELEEKNLLMATDVILVSDCKKMMDAYVHQLTLFLKDKLAGINSKMREREKELQKKSDERVREVEKFYQAKHELLTRRYLEVKSKGTQNKQLNTQLEQLQEKYNELTKELVKQQQSSEEEEASLRMENEYLLNQLEAFNVAQADADTQTEEEEEEHIIEREMEQPVLSLHSRATSACNLLPEKPMCDDFCGQTDLALLDELVDKLERERESELEQNMVKERERARILKRQSKLERDKERQREEARRKAEEEKRRKEYLESLRSECIQAFDTDGRLIEMMTQTDPEPVVFVPELVDAATQLSRGELQLTEAERMEEEMKRRTLLEAMLAVRPLTSEDETQTEEELLFGKEGDEADGANAANPHEFSREEFEFRMAQLRMKEEKANKAIQKTVSDISQQVGYLQKVIEEVKTINEALSVDVCCHSCFQIFTEPVTFIPCGHTVCKKCALKNLLDGNPQCEQCVSTISRGFIKNFVAEMMASRESVKDIKLKELSTMLSELVSTQKVLEMQVNRDASSFEVAPALLSHIRRTDSSSSLNSFSSQDSPASTARSHLSRRGSFNAPSRNGGSGAATQQKHSGLSLVRHNSFSRLRRTSSTSSLSNSPSKPSVVLHSPATPSNLSSSLSSLSQLSESETVVESESNPYQTNLMECEMTPRQFEEKQNSLVKNTSDQSSPSSLIQSDQNSNEIEGSLPQQQQESLHHPADETSPKKKKMKTGTQQQQQQQQLQKKQRGTSSNSALSHSPQLQRANKAAPWRKSPTPLDLSKGKRSVSRN